MTRLKRVVILQPSYLPWLGYFDQMFKSHVFVLYDDVQFDKHGWRNRNRVLGRDGPLWLTVPVVTHGQGRPTNAEVHVAPTPPRWAVKQLQTLRTYYAKAPHFHDVYDALEPVLTRPWQRLLDLNRTLLDVVCTLLGLDRPVLLAGDLGIPGEATARLVDICAHLGATHYLSGDAGRDYIEPDRFAQAGITLEYHDYHHPTYPQLGHGDFVSHLSVIDLLMNVGPASLHTLVDARADPPLTLDQQAEIRP